jgi:hypothetical protein
MADSLTDVTQEAFDTAEATLIDLVRAAYPTMDLRRGTVLRDVLIRPAAAIMAMNDDNITDVQEKQSLVNLAASETATAEDVDAILANFSVERQTGTKASGRIQVRVDADRVYTLASGFSFATLEGLEFVTTQNYTIKSDADTTGGEILLRLSDDGTYYYFVISVTAGDVGTDYELEQGTALEPSESLYGFVAAEAYEDFTGGLNAETINELIARLPAAISYRAMESRTSIEAKLRDEYEGTAITLQTLSVQGYGDPAQLRDKHNPMGIAVGSRVDVYPRTYSTPRIITLEKTGTLIAANTYQFTIDAADAPGFYAIRIIADVDATINPAFGVTGIPAIGSYAFTEVREAYGINDTFHDIDPDNSVIETAYTVFQKSTVTVTGVPQTGAERNFKVELYAADGVLDMQTFVDSTPVRNVEGDFLIRSPLICLVNINARVFYDPQYPIDTDQMTQDLLNYINTKSFTRRLTRSELASLLHADGATRIELGCTGMELVGIIRDAAGEEHVLQGDQLDIEVVADETVLMTADTCVFGTEVGRITLEAIAE